MKSNKAEKIYKVVMLVILTALVTFIGTTVFMRKTMNENSKYQAASSASQIQEKIKYYRNFIDKYYIHDINEEDMINGALKGYFQGLGDDYSEYITKEEMEDYLADATGKYVGIGVYIANEIKTDKIVVLSPIKGSPAEEAGIKAGDYILKVDGVEYNGERLSDASSSLKSDEGTFVTVTIQRGEDIFDLEVERRTIKVNHVESKVVDNNIGYISVTSFDDGCYEEFVENYDTLKQQNIKGLIIDLRNNGGGIVKESTKIADLFVEKDKILLITKSKNKEEELTKSESDKQIDIPVVILVNDGTASASEILTVALKENKDNVKVVGTKTYGKGVIQSIFTLKDGSGMKLTTEEYFSPNHNTIHKVGIQPDYEVDLNLPEGVTTYVIEDKDDNQLQKAIELLK